MKREIQRLRVLQVNLHHSRVASAALCTAIRYCDVALIQEHWTYKGKIKGQKEVGGEQIYSTSIQHPRTCVLVKKAFKHCRCCITALGISFIR
jgi:hypothetical protein